MADLKNDIEKYLRGELTPAEMHALERKALSDPFLADALDGATLISPENFQADLKSLQASIEERAAEKEKVVSLWHWPMRIAAGFLIVAVSTFVIVSLVNQDTTPSELAQGPEAMPAPAENSAPVLDSAMIEQEQSAGEPARKDERLSMAKPESPKTNGPSTAPATTTSKQRSLEAEAEGSTTQPVLKSENEPVASTPANSLSGYADLHDKSDVAAKEVAEQQVARMEEENEAKVAAAQDLSKRKKTAVPAESVAKATPAKFIQGKVTSADGDELPGVNVLIKGTNMGTVTNAEGEYHLEINTSNPDLVFSFIGLESKEVEAGDRDEVNVVMQEDVSQLSEVVVVGYGTRESDEEEEEEIPTVEFAVPAGGRQEFKRYLERSIVYPELALENKVEGKVTIQFTVEKSGELTDFKVIKGLGFGCDQEVIRLIKQGPKWAATKRNAEAVKDKVKVRLRFRLPKK